MRWQFDLLPATGSTSAGVIGTAGGRRAGVMGTTGLLLLLVTASWLIPNQTRLNRKVCSGAYHISRRIQNAMKKHNWNIELLGLQKQKKAVHKNSVLRLMLIATPFAIWNNSSIGQLWCKKTLELITSNSIFTNKIICGGKIACSLYVSCQTGHEITI